MSAPLWFLYVRMFAGDPIVESGPYTEAECVRCGETLTAAQAELVRRLRRKAGSGWICLPADKNVPPAPTTTRRACEGS